MLWNSENEESPTAFYPPPRRFRQPEWLEQLEDDLYRGILDEVYSALNSGLNAIALMGVRSILDLWVSANSSNGNNFPKKLEGLVTVGTLSARQAEILHATFDAGSAAAHRGFIPTAGNARSALDAVESLLHQELLLPGIAELKNVTPPRR